MVSLKSALYSVYLCSTFQSKSRNGSVLKEGFCFHLERHKESILCVPRLLSEANLDAAVNNNHHRERQGRRSRSAFAKGFARLSLGFAHRVYCSVTALPLQQSGSPFQASAPISAPIPRVRPSACLPGTYCRIHTHPPWRAVKR